MNSKDPSKDLIITELDAIYRGPAWHGPAVLEALDGVDAPKAARKLANERNSIWEIVLHLTHGRHLLIERLTQQTFDFPRSVREPWWPVSEPDTSEAAWQRDLLLLDEYHAKLVDAVRKANGDALSRIPDGADQSLARQLLGMAIHDAYHAGQIRLLALQ